MNGKRTKVKGQHIWKKKSKKAFLSFLTTQNLQKVINFCWDFLYLKSHTFSKTETKPFHARQTCKVGRNHY